MARPASLPFRVLSGRPADLEAGFEPFLEATFATEAEAVTFIDGWNALYADAEVEFFLEVK